MRYKHTLLLSLILLCFPSVGYAQLWSGIIAFNRASNWSTAGVEGGIPSATWTQCGATIAPYTGTGATIQAAINNCGTNQYVQLGAGTFTLSSGFSLSKSNVVLRGMGANQTFLVINGVTTGANCGYFFHGGISVCASSSVPQNSANWTAGYSQGTTRITLSNTTGIVVGTVLFLDQLDDSSDGWPAAGDIYVCEEASTACSAQGGGTGFGRQGRATMQAVKVTNIVGGGQLDVTPPISLPNYRSEQSPGALWAANTSDILRNSGVENLSVTFSGITGDDAVGFEVINTLNVWFKGVRTVFLSTSRHYTFVIVNSLFTTIRDSYIYDPSAVLIASYPVSPNNTGSLLIENNILQGPSADVVVNGPMSNSVIAYNFFPGHNGPGAMYHGAGEGMNLFEGNVWKGFWSDTNHGRPLGFTTIFRNAMVGDLYDEGGCSVCNPLQAQTGGRFYNMVGNVMGDTIYNTYAVTLAPDSAAIYGLGWRGDASGSVPPNDSNVKRTLFRWGNWDSVTNATRWCGNSSNTGWSTTCGSVSEVPSAITNFPNPVPSTEALPTSFYLASKPKWWPAAKPWPSIGPDVIGGNIPNMGGHAYTNPAADCYLNVMGGPPQGLSPALMFNPDTCYGSSSVSSAPPGPPTNLTAQ